MANKIYNVTRIQSAQASVGDNRVDGIFAYKGFNSRNIKQGFKIYDTDLIKQDLLNHFNIKKGEKLENPEFGTIIWSMIYEPMDDNAIRMVTQDVERIVNLDPRTGVDSLKVDATEQGLRIEVGLRYIDFDQVETLYLTFDKSSVPNSTPR
jgi:phage baseplate assembly protein W